MNNLFTKIDNYNHSFLGFNPIGALKNIHMWRKYILFLTLASLFSWVILGWESTWNQLGTYVQSAPLLIFGQTTTALVQTEASSFYGIGQHLSSAVIYGFMFFFLSIYLEKQGIFKSLNFFLTTALTLFSVGIYEITYNILYSNLQNQAWTFTFAGRQGLNLSIFVFFVVLGFISLIYLYSLNFRPKITKFTLAFLSCSVLTYVLWVFYPFPITHLSVGTWTSTNLFPQTMYAVNIGGGLGNAYFVQNNFLHLVNVLNKAFMALTVLSLTMVRSKTK